MDFSDLFQTINTAVLVCKAGTGFSVCYGNEAALRLLQEGRGNALCTGALSELLCIADADFWEALLVLRVGAPPLQTEASLLSPYGAPLALQVAAKSFEAEGSSYRILRLAPTRCGTAHTGDACLLAVCRARLYHHLDVLRTVTDHFEGMICVYDAQTEDMFFANRLLAQTLERSLDALQGEKSGSLLRCLLPNFFETARREGVSRELQHPDTGRWYLLWHTSIHWVNGRAAILERILDISERKEYEAALERIASIDIMTGAYKREWGLLLMARLMEQQCPEEEACLVFLDIDKLKCVNDRFGHGRGDEMIRETVRIIRACMRKSDLICRWGGDEFLIVLRASEKKTLQIMEKMQTCLADFNATGDLPFSLAVSYGVVPIPARGPLRLEDLIEEADRKMYAEKERRAAPCLAETEPLCE